MHPIWMCPLLLQALDPDAHTRSASYYLRIYLGLSLLMMVADVLRDIVAVWGSYRASRRMHERLLSHVLMLPLAFFDRQPLGRLLNRFTKDTEAVDEDLFNLVSLAVTPHCLFAPARITRTGATKHHQPVSRRLKITCIVPEVFLTPDWKG